MNGFERDDDYPDVSEIRDAEDKIDLWMPELMAEAAEIIEWDQTLAFNFIRRAYARGRVDAFEIISQEPEG